MAGAGRSREIPLKAKYRDPKPRGKYRADYMGNSGVNLHKHVLLPAVHGIKRKRVRRKTYR
jgi:hypothetical protein